MPGTIQVSILELVGLPSVPQSLSTGIKVSMGKQAHEIQDKGEFSFTLVSFRDDLNVSIHDYKGNEIAHTGVRTRSIVEKGVWDDLFPLNGGGHVHMILRFILTEDEQNRIRSMRESAARKKRKDLLPRSHSSSDFTVASGGRPATSEDSLKSAQYTQPENVNHADTRGNRISPGSNAELMSEASPGLKKQASPGLKKQAISNSKSTGALDKLPVYRRVKETIQLREQEQQRQLDETPSSVRTMILALESSPMKEELPTTTKTRATTRFRSTTTTVIASKAPSLKKIVAMNAEQVMSNPSTPDGIEKRREVGNSIAPYRDLLIRKKDQFNETELQFSDQMCNEKNIPELQLGKTESKQEKESPKKLCRSPPFERSKPSWKTLIQALPRRNQFATGLPAEKRSSTSCNRLVVDKNWRSKHWKPSQHKVESKVSCANEHFFFNSFRRWIFLDESIYSCVLSDDRPFLDPLEGCLSNCSQDTNQKKLTDVGIVPSENENSSVGSKGLEPGNRPEDRDSTRPFGQAKKIAIMVGFGLLVFFTRQRK